VSELPFVTRLWFAWASFFRVLFDGAFAARVWGARAELPPPSPAPAPSKPDDLEARTGGALQLLALLQREGRFVDFLEQDVAGFSDADVGAAARVVHDGCRKALEAHAKLAPVRDEEEGAKISLPAGFDAARVKLTGNVGGSGPYQGVLRHRGWRVSEITLPLPMKGYDPKIVAPAEVEL
jgi:Domain of unknown function (DUF2760)